MSKKHFNTSQVTIHLDLELAQAIDQTMLSFGMESRAETIMMMCRAWGSMFPENSTVFEIAVAAAKKLRKDEFEALATHYETRARIFRSSL